MEDGSGSIGQSVAVVGANKGQMVAVVVATCGGWRWWW